MFPVWSLDRVPKLYQLKLQCVNAQLNEKILSLMLNFQCYRNEIDLPHSRHSSFFFSSEQDVIFLICALNRVSICVCFGSGFKTLRGPHLSEIYGSNPPGKSVRIGCTEKSRKCDYLTPKRFCGKKNVLHHVNHFRNSRPKLEVIEWELL